MLVAMPMLVLLAMLALLRTRVRVYVVLVQHVLPQFVTVHIAA